jgi:hypothetical protein
MVQVLLRCHPQHASWKKDWPVRVRLLWHCHLCQELR